jgi:dipeptidyl aminopeptidase/acylaminoacyl peptidase
VCDFFGPTDFTRMMEGGSHMDHYAANSPESLLIGGPVLENRDKCAKANPITYVTPDDPPFLIVHGEQDRTVPIGSSELLDAALKKAGVDVTFVRVRRGGHGFRGNTDPSPQRIDEMVAEFFDKHLRKPKDKAP